MPGMRAVVSSLQWLVAPHPRITTSEDRRKARLFAILMLVQIGIVVAGLLGTNQAMAVTQGRGIWDDLDAWVVIGGLGAIIIAYVLLRTGLFRAGVILYILVTAVVALTAPFVPDPDAEIGMLASAFIPVILTSVAFSNRAAVGVLVAVLVTGCTRLVFAGLPASKTGTGFALLVVVLVSGALVLVFRSHMAALERNRLAQVMQSEEATRLSRERYHQLFEMVGDGLFVVDGQARLVEVNQGACAQLGYSREELLTKSCNEVVGRNVLRPEAVMQEVITNGRASFESTLLRKDGSSIPVELNFTLIKYGGEPAFLGIARDLTERNRTLAERARLERQLQQAVKMESIGRLAGGVAHDFNNILAAILGNAELALRTAEPTEQIHRRLLEIQTAGQSAAALTRQLLAFSRREVVSPSDVVLEEQVERLRSMLVRLLGEDVQLETVSDGRRGAVHIDPGLLERIIVNLAVNARDAMPTGGRLVIETANRTLDAEYTARRPGLKPGDYVLLAMSDTGSGMSDEVKAHLFEPFFTTKSADKGTGLGLATTYGAVQQSNGHVEVYSEVGHGTVFKIFFPRVFPSGQVRQAPVKAESLRLGAETVLVVEDAPLVLEITVRMLTHLGYTVLSASAPAEALELAGNRPEAIDLLLTDIVMPGSSGRELAEALRQIHPEARVLYTSGYSQEVIADQGVVDGGLTFLGKPYTMQALSDKVRAVLEA